MKNIPLLLGSLVLILFISCGNDTVTNNDPVPGEEVIFSMDSFAINLDNGFMVIDTNITIQDVPKVKVDFSCASNIDSTISTAFFRITAIDSFNTYLDTIKRSVAELNSTYSFMVEGSTYFSIAIVLQVNLTAFYPTYLRLRNVKIVKMPQH